MGISQILGEVRDKLYGGLQWRMALEWTDKKTVLHQATLSRWIRSERVPDPSWYDFLAEKLSDDLDRPVSVEEVHRLCQNERKMIRETSLAAS